MKMFWGVLLFMALTTNAQKKFTISANNTVNVYNAFMYSSLHAERIEDMKSMPVRNEDIMTLNEMLGSTKDRGTHVIILF